MRTMKDTVTLYQVHHNYKMETKVAADDKHFFLSVSARRRRRPLAPVPSLLLFRAHSFYRLFWRIQFITQN